MTTIAVPAQWFADLAASAAAWALRYPPRDTGAVDPALDGARRLMAQVATEAEVIAAAEAAERLLGWRASTPEAQR